jgi:hypothetical protein
MIESQYTLRPLLLVCTPLVCTALVYNHSDSEYYCRIGFYVLIISLYGKIYSTLHARHITIPSTHNFYFSLNIFDYLLLVTLY